MIVINESIAKASPINTIATVLMLESLDSFLFKVILLCDFCDFSLLRRRGENLLDKFLFIVMFYRKFRLCITALQATPALGKAHTPKDARAYPKAPSGRELPTKSGEGECVTMKLAQT